MMKEIGQKNPLWVLRTGVWVIIRTSLITHKGNSDRSQSWLSALIAQTYFLNAHNVYFCECSNILPFLWGVKLKRRRFSFLFVEDNLKTLAPWVVKTALWVLTRMLWQKSKYSIVHWASNNGRYRKKWHPLHVKNDRKIRALYEHSEGCFWLHIGKSLIAHKAGYKCLITQKKITDRSQTWFVSVWSLGNNLWTLITHIFVSMWMLFILVWGDPHSLLRKNNLKTLRPLSGQNSLVSAHKNALDRS